VSFCRIRIGCDGHSLGLRIFAPASVELHRYDIAMTRLDRIGWPARDRAAAGSPGICDQQVTVTRVGELEGIFKLLPFIDVTEVVMVLFKYDGRCAGFTVDDGCWQPTAV